MTKKTNLMNWALSFLGAAAIVSSMILALPTISKATIITVPCDGKRSVTCSGEICSGTDGEQCECIDAEGKITTKKCEDLPPIID